MASVAILATFKPLLRLLRPAFPASIAPAKSPLKSLEIALPIKPKPSITFSTLSMTNSFMLLPKFLRVSTGFVNRSIINLPRAASLSVKTSTTAPKTPIILFQAFCPSSDDLKACAKAVIAISNAPIPVPIIAIFIRLKPLVAAPTDFTMPPMPDIRPPVC